MIKMIFASDSEGGIGFQNRLPWPHDGEDMKWFQEHTTNHVVVMGSNTARSIGKPLKDRINIVLSTKTNDPSLEKFQPSVYNEIESGTLEIFLEQLSMSFGLDGKDIWIIGGSNLYDKTIHLVDEIYWTRFEGTYQCDTYFNSLKYMMLKFGPVFGEQKGLLNFSIWKRVSN